ncbi:MAG: hypothetical protein ACK4Q5_18580 [Saprospiraceae bacterium]
MRIIALAALLHSLLLSCNLRNSQPALPDTPETVVQLWQQSIDKNNFELARRLSTGEALTYIAELSELNSGDTLEWEDNPMLNLRCQTIGDSAHCTYHFEDETGEPDPGQLALRRIKGQWLVSRTDFEVELLDSLNDPAGKLVFPEDSTDAEIE